MFCILYHYHQCYFSIHNHALCIFLSILAHNVDDMFYFGPLMIMYLFVIVNFSVPQYVLAYLAFPNMSLIFPSPNMSLLTLLTLLFRPPICMSLHLAYLAFPKYVCPCFPPKMKIKFSAICFFRPILIFSSPSLKPNIFSLDINLCQFNL